MAHKVVRGQKTGREIPVEVKVGSLKELGLEMRDGFYHETLGDDTEIFMLPQRLDYREALNPSNWRTEKELSGSRRSRLVESSANGERVGLVVKPVRSVYDIMKRGFPLGEFSPDPVHNVGKAQIVREQMYYADDEIVVKYEMPIGFVRHPDGRREEVFRAHEEAVHEREYLHMGDAERLRMVDRCLEKLSTMGIAGGRYIIDGYDVRDPYDVMFETDGRGRTVAIKYDTEFVKVIDRDKFKRVRSVVNETLHRNGIDLSRFTLADAIAYQLAGLAYNMTEGQAQELLGNDVFGRFLESLGRFCRRAYGRGGAVNESNTLIWSLTYAAGIPAEKSAEYLREMAGVMDSAENGGQFSSRRGELEGRIEKSLLYD